MRALQPKFQMSGGFEKFGPTFGAGRGITTESASVSRCGDSRTEKLFECMTGLTGILMLVLLFYDSVTFRKLQAVEP